MRREPSGAERGLRTERELGRIQLKAYYDVMVEDPAFRQALGHLAASLPSDLDPDPYPPMRFREAVEGFATAWCFPTDEGVMHLWDCLLAAHGRPEPWQWLTPEIDLGDGVDVGTVEVDQSGESLFHLRDGLDPDTLEPLIVPPTLPTITYDPTSEDRASFRGRVSRLLKTVEKSIVEQAERIEQDAGASGWRAVPPRRARTDLRRMALRLYRRTRGMRPREIADREQREVPDEICDAENVRATVGEWARALRIELPALPEGRPATRNPRT